jgi:uncharacterized protein (DUF433 family)
MSVKSPAGQGVYSVQEASRLTRVAPRRVRRWFEGYEFPSSAGARRMPPVVVGDSRSVEGHLQLSFLDLIEIRLIAQFLEFGVGWKEMRRAAQVGRELLATEHPFASCKFKTDGRSVFADIGGPTDSKLIQLRDRQQVFRKVIEPALLGVEFDASKAARWWPLGERASIVIDPARCFGRAVGARSGVPAEILAGYAERFGVADASSWYAASASEVRDAVKFAKRFAA